MGHFERRSINCLKLLGVISSWNMNDVRHQVFISSTYMDLQEARHAVIQALLELDCIPYWHADVSRVK